MINTMTATEPLVIESFVINVPEDDYLEYVPGTTYAFEENVIVTFEEDGVTKLPQLQRKKYRSSEAGNLGSYPPNSDKWGAYGSINAYRVIDGTLNRQTEQALNITMSFDYNRASKLALFNVEATSATITLTDALGEETIIERSLVTRAVSGYFSYLFKKFTYQNILLLDLPFIEGGSLSISLKSDSIVKVGTVMHGLEEEIAATLWDGASLGMIDFSKVVEDPLNGDTSFQEGTFKQRGSFTAVFETPKLNAVYKTLTEFRGKACLHIATDIYEPTIFFGSYTDWEILLTNPTTTELSISYKGIA